MKELYQLPANKAIQELEEGRGWLLGVEDEKDTALETRYLPRWSDEKSPPRLAVLSWPGFLLLRCCSGQA